MPEKNVVVRLVHSTPDAKKILALAKNTRLLGSNDFEVVYNRKQEEIDKDVDYSLSTIRGPLEFIHYIFLINNASRAMTHQLVRHRVMSFAQQSLRISKSLDYYMPEGIQAIPTVAALFEEGVETSQNLFETMVENGVDIQDARGVLPIATTSSILMKANLRAMLELFEVRLCLRVQGEFQGAALQMAGLIGLTHPWVYSHIGPHCIVKGQCLFPRFKCPISTATPALKGLSKEDRIKSEGIWNSLKGKGFQPK